MTALCCAGPVALAEPSSPLSPELPSGTEGGILGPETEELIELNKTILEKLSASLVDVDYYLKEDDTGQRPPLAFGYFCPNCNDIHFSDGSN